ncbi:1-deoxy-D-xylulose-5-phosphate synthase N-terminal domain-containing protein [Streptomyces sp. NBC_01465]|uniref:1-deoxy-D-xylulose-5-phosphate synthase N-terminal domain-containing protein n=1 Tax=Streptomyces sp. NBC_01465 TaxID=2903878 RepID=UPI002E332FEA|nr:1-deoxy-D-xylulose-5-phosphate synthase N-terminal domain-containing protein [Streptomyces sp. NBC_01465]
MSSPTRDRLGGTAPDLHRVRRSPRDTLVVDAGHQTYAHQPLTCRHRDFACLRQADSLLGHPSRSVGQQRHER